MDQCYAIDNFNFNGIIIVDDCRAININARTAEKADEGSTNMQLVAHANARKLCILPASAARQPIGAYRGVWAGIEGCVCTSCAVFSSAVILEYLGTVKRVGSELSCTGITTSTYGVHFNG